MASIDKVTVSLYPLDRTNMPTDDALRERFKYITILMDQEYEKMNSLKHKGPKTIHAMAPYCSCKECWTCQRCGLHLKDTTPCALNDTRYSYWKGPQIHYPATPPERQYAIAFAEPVSAEKRA